MMDALGMRWRPVPVPVFLAACMYLVLAYCCLVELWGFKRDSIFGFILPPMAGLFTLGLFLHHSRIRTWAIYTPLVALYGFLASFAQMMRISHFPGAHASSGDHFLYVTWQFLLVFFFTLPATFMLLLPSVRKILIPETVPTGIADGSATSKRWYQIPWQFLLAVACYAAVIYFSIVATLGFSGDYLFRYLLPVLAAAMLIGLLRQSRIAKYMAMVIPALAFTGITVFSYIGDSMNLNSAPYSQPGDTFTYVACELIPVFIFTLPAGVVFHWQGIANAFARKKAG